jgi:hypothetical protein
MTIQVFSDYMALKITAEINGKYHTPEELHDLLKQLWGREVPKTL